MNLQLALGPVVSLAPTSRGILTETDLVHAFLSGRNERTVKAYSQDLADFQAFMGAGTVDEAAKVLLANGHGPANATALAYKTHLLQRGLQSATVNRRLAALRSLVQLARIMGLVPWHLEVRNVKSEPFRDTRGPGKQGFRRLLDQLDGKLTPKAIRDRCALRLLYDLALRCGEVVSLDVEDVDIAQATLAVRGKGSTSKQVLSVPEATRGVLQAWLDSRGREPGPLFTNLDRANKKGRLSTVGLYNVVRGLGERVGLKTRPHGLRHSGITEACKLAAANGIGLEEVLDYSRHSRKSIAILMVYRDRERNVQGQLASLVSAAV